VSIDAGRRAVVWAGVRLALLLPVAGGARAQGSGSTSEHQIKAAFLYKFLGFIEWPAGVFATADQPIVVGVAGADPIAEELGQMVANRNVNGRPLSARKLRRGDPVVGIHLLFIGRDARHADWLAAVRALPVLVVSESEEAFAQGSAINFVIVDNKVRFDVAPGAAELNNLKISSRLLTVARKVTAS
jgi:hypothetical protein